MCNAWSRLARVCCLVLLAGGLGPRIVLFVWWLFGDKPDAAFDGWVWGLLGFLLAPWTTLMYVIAWSPVVGVSGFWDGVLIAAGVALDVATYAAKPAQRMRSSSTY
jgi:hypothetical protein